MREGQKKSCTPALRQFRNELIRRVFREHGDIQRVADAVNMQRETAARWRDPGEVSMPDVFQAKLIAESRAETPCWLAFGHGARDPRYAEAAGQIATLLEQNPALSEVTTRFINTTTEGQDAILATARLAPAVRRATVIGAPATAPSSANAAAEFVLQLPQAEELDSILSGLVEHLSTLPTESKAFQSSKPAVLLLDRILSALRLKERQDSASATSAQSPTVAPVRAKPTSDPAQGILPLEAPPDAKGRKKK